MYFMVSNMSNQLYHNFHHRTTLSIKYLRWSIKYLRISRWLPVISCHFLTFLTFPFIFGTRKKEKKSIHSHHNPSVDLGQVTHQDWRTDQEYEMGFCCHHHQDIDVSRSTLRRWSSTSIIGHKISSTGTRRLYSIHDVRRQLGDCISIHDVLTIDSDNVWYIRVVLPIHMW